MHSVQGMPAAIWPVLSSVHQRTALSYTDFRNISVAVAAARNLPVASVLERITCGLASTHALPVLQIEHPTTREMCGGPLSPTPPSCMTNRSMHAFTCGTIGRPPWCVELRGSSLSLRVHAEAIGRM